MLKKQIKKIKRFSRILVETGELIFYRTFLSGNGETVDRCLVVIQNSHLGDFLLSLPFFQRLKQESGLPLLLISDHRIKDLAEASGVFDGFIGIDFKKASSYKHLFYRWKTLGQLRKISAVKAVQCFGVGKTSLEDCMLLAVKSPDKYVFVDNFYNVQRSGTFYEALRTKFFDHPLPYRLELSLVANENNYANFITGIDQAVTVGSLECFEPLPERDESLGDYCLIIPGADDPRRRWEPEKFAKATQELAEKNPDWQLLLSGSPSEQTIVKQVYDFLPAELQKKAKIRAPEPDKLASIKRLMSDCKHAKLVLTNDTGPMHIAAKYGVKTICITGGWHWGIFAPCKEYKSVEFIYEKKPCYNCGSICKYNTTPFKCVNELTVEKVAAENSEEKTCLARQVAGNQQLIPPSSQKSAELKKQDIFDSPQLDNLSFFKKSATKIILFLILFLQITSDCWLPALLGATEIKVSMLVAVKNLGISCIVYAFIYCLINLFKPLFSKIILCVAILLSSLLMAVVIGSITMGNVYSPGIWYIVYESSCNFDDFVSFIKSPSSLYAFIILFILIFISIIECTFICKYFEPFSGKEKKYFLTISTALLLFLIFRNTVLRYSPGYIVDNLAYFKIVKTFIYCKNYWNDFEEAMRNPHLPANIRNKNQCDVLVFVVGESSTRNRYSLYGYKRKTNPELEKIRNQLLVFTDVISADCRTSFAWAYCFTRKTIQEPFNVQCSLMQILAQAGFCNMLYTNQIWHDLHSSYIRRLFYSDNELIDLSKKSRLDDVLVEVVRNMPKQGSPIALFLQLKGNHIDYKDTYTEDFAVFSGVKDEYTQQLSSKWQDVYNQYDNSICYTDRIIYDIIKVFQSDKRRCAVIYFSDHGESVPTKSGMNFRDPTKKETYEIPFFIYFNPSYIKSNSLLVKRVGNNKHIPLQGDRFFEGFLTIAGVDFQSFNKNDDFTSSDFKKLPRYINDGKMIYPEK